MHAIHAVQLFADQRFLGGAVHLPDAQARQQLAGAGGERRGGGGRLQDCIGVRVAAAGIRAVGVAWGRVGVLVARFAVIVAVVTVAVVAMTRVTGGRVRRLAIIVPAAGAAVRARLMFALFDRR
ncbi:hypothetical protein [Achromobacter mucicolens]|uniref:hypothetical protein n=1 Tax=Achromobacter mucicolens TaxID=1389922 RepID=UPI001F3B308A|nr:hypothetical protein [Achromobacter mucicolens]WGJ93396.1 hypothetical protein QEP15_09750 [Achromobacter mucicolens]